MFFYYFQPVKKGTLGLVTEATLKIRKLPESVVYGSLYVSGLGPAAWLHFG